MDTQYTVLFYIALVVWCSCVTRAAKDGTCPEPCFCNDMSNMVYCTRKGLTRIPNEIPADSLQLNLNGNMLETTLIQRRNFSRFTNLEHLYLSECGIERIEVGAFTDLRHLEFLDLSSNRIRVLEDYTFRGLSLSHLFLNGNRNLNIKRNALADFATSGLYLQECSLSKLNLDVFAHLNGTLTTLLLNDNELVNLDRRFMPMLSTLTHIRLGSNPFHCNCEVLWLKEFYDKNGDKFQGADAPSCLGPQNLKSKLFGQISLFDFQCQPPSFRNIDAVFKDNRGMLRCTASGDPSPSLYWVQPNAAPIVFKPSSNESLRYNEAVLNISAETTRKQDLSGSYFCVALNDAGNMTLTFNLTWPSERMHTDPTIKVVPKLEASSEEEEIELPGVPRRTRPKHTTPASSTTIQSHINEQDSFNHISNSEEDKHLNFEKDNASSSTKDSEYTADKVSTNKLYTLAELIGAILGTFVGTLLICCIVIPLYFRRRWKNNNSPHHRAATKSNLQETMYLNGSGSRGPPQLPPRPGHSYNYFDTSISSMSKR